MEEILKAAKAFQKELPGLKGYTIRIKYDSGSLRHRIIFEKVNEKGNNLGFEMMVPMFVI